MKIQEFQKLCWDVEKQSDEYRRDISNWERIYITRKISIWITFLLKDSFVAPTHVTVFWVLLQIAGSVILAYGERSLSLVAICILYLAWILDNVDGELARYKRQFSVVGNFLDMVGHEILFPLIFGSLTFSFIVGGEKLPVIVCGLVATALVTPLTKMQENVKLLLCLKALSAKPEIEDVSPDAQPDHGVGNNFVTTVLGALFSQPCMFYLLLLAVIVRQESAYVAVYGVGIAIMFIPKLIARSRVLANTVENPKLLNQLFRPEWMDD